MITFFKDLLKTKPKEAAASIKKLLYFDRNRNNQIKEITKEIEILNIAPTLENLLARNDYQSDINSIVKMIYSSNPSKINELRFVIINEDNKKTEIRVGNDTNIYLLLLKKEYDLYYVPPPQAEVIETPKGGPQASSSIKESSCQLFSKKNKKFVKSKLILWAERVCLITTGKKPKEKSIKFSDIFTIEEKSIVIEAKDKGNYLRLFISNKSYLLQFKSDYDYGIWVNIIKGKVNLWRENYIIAKYDKIEKDSTNSIIQGLNDIIFNLFDLNSILSIDKSRNIFYAFTQNEDVNSLFDLIVLYKKSIHNSNHYDAVLYYERVFDLILEKGEKFTELVSEDCFKLLYEQKTKIENCKELIRKIQSEPMNPYVDVNTTFKDYTPLNIFDGVYNNIIECKFSEVYNEKKNDVDFNKQIEGVLLYYFEKENDYGLNDFIDLYGNIKNYILDK